MSSYWENPHLHKKMARRGWWRKEFIAGLAMKSNPARILEFGCSNGEILNYISVNSPEIKLTGIDISSRAIVEAKSKYSAIEFISGGGEVLSEFKDNSFDTIFTAGTLIYIQPERISAVLREMLRLSNGHIYHIERQSNEEGIYEQLDGATKFQTDYVRRYGELGIKTELVDLKEMFVDKTFGGADSLIHASIGE